MKPLIPLFLMIFLYGCGIEFGETEYPPSVPESALWIGGPDGGVYVNVLKTNNRYTGSIYADVTGVIIFQGKFRYTGEKNFNVNDKNSYSFWDGDYLYLRNNEKLIAIYPD